MKRSHKYLCAILAVSGLVCVLLGGYIYNAESKKVIGSNQDTTIRTIAKKQEEVVAAPILLPSKSNSLNNETQNLHQERYPDYSIIDKELEKESQKALLAAKTRRQQIGKSKKHLPAIMSDLATLAELSRKPAKNRSQIEKICSDLHSYGDDLVTPLMEMIKSGASYKFVHEAVKVLAAIDTDASQKALLDLALGKGLPVRQNGSSWAARNFLKNLRNKADAWILLTSKDDGILSISIRALQSQPLDMKYMDRLEVLQQSKNNYLRTNVVKLITEEPKHLSSARKVSLIVESLKTVKLISNFNTKILADRLGTEGSRTYCSFIDNLTQIPDARKYLQKKVDELDGLTQITVKIALTKLKDASYKQDLKDFIVSKDSYRLGELRQKALQALAVVRTDGDVSFLENLAKNDPYEIVGFRHRLYEYINGKIIHKKDMNAPIENPDWPDEPDSRKAPDTFREYLIRTVAKKILKREK